VGEVHRGHATATEFPLDAVAVRERGGQAVERRIGQVLLS
jgi:hypothetical protein